MDPHALEQTLVIIKPDALKLSLTGYILSTLSESHTGLRLAGAKIVHVDELLAREHYAEHASKPFFPNLIDYITGRDHYPEDPHRRRVIALIYCGPQAVEKVRSIAGPTNPHIARDSAPNTLRALGTIVTEHNDDGEKFIARIDNLIHASASAEEAEQEIKLWFRPADVMPYMRAYQASICETHYYWRKGQLATEHQPGDYCILGVGDLAWTSDIEALEHIVAGRPSRTSLTGVTAKYLINTMLNPGLHAKATDSDSDDALTLACMYT